MGAIAATVQIELVTAAGPGVRAIVATPEQWQRLLGEGGAALGGDDLATLRRLAAATRFESKSGQMLPWSSGDGRDGVVVGRAAGGRATASLRRAAAHAAQSVAADRAWSLTWLDDARSTAAAELVGAAAEGVLLASYRFCRTGREPPAPSAAACALVVAEPAAATRALERARAIAAGVVLARDLVNAPAAELGPSELAAAALALGSRHGFRCESWRGDDVARRGFRMVAAVGRGSAKPPTVTVLRRDGDPAQPALALIGKGVVFDSGGLDLKPSDAMLLMRKDMAGAATVLGALEAAARLDLRVPLLAVLPSAENMVGPDCFRPGDILTAYDGTTVEIGNTDAEGRLLLADAIGYAREQGARRLVDVATLTGAARVALGPDVPALFGTDEELVALLERESEAGDERMWRLPLVDAYERQLDSPFADVNHVSHDKRAGAITAALFLRRFAGTTPWAHVDLYGWEDSGRPDSPKGANGMGVRTLVRVLERLAGGGG